MDDPQETLLEAGTGPASRGLRAPTGVLAPAKIGVLALQGDFEAHAQILTRVGAEVFEVRTPAQLDGLQGLVLPGGESTTLLRLMRIYGFDTAIPAFHRQGGFLFGTCAGLILLAKRVVEPEQESLGLIDVTVARNAFGRQIESFVAQGLVILPPESSAEEPQPHPLEMIFIRAPRIRTVGPGVTVLGRLEDEPVLVQSGRILAATFHPEIAGDPRVHAYFRRLVGEGEPSGGSPGTR